MSSVSDDGPSSQRPLVGLVQMREHCTFAWRKATPAAVPSIEIDENHCPQCIAEVRQRGYRLLTADGKEYQG
jgi:hypothetical protein